MNKHLEQVTSSSAPPVRCAPTHPACPQAPRAGRSAARGASRSRRTRTRRACRRTEVPSAPSPPRLRGARRRRGPPPATARRPALVRRRRHTFTGVKENEQLVAARRTYATTRTQSSAPARAASPCTPASPPGSSGAPRASRRRRASGDPGRAPALPDAEPLREHRAERLDLHLAEPGQRGDARAEVVPVARVSPDPARRPRRSRRQRARRAPARAAPCCRGNGIGGALPERGVLLGGISARDLRGLEHPEPLRISSGPRNAVGTAPAGRARSRSAARADPRRSADSPRRFP